MSDFERGYNDCKWGQMCRQGESKEYYNGYGRRYEEEQQLTHKTEMQA